MAPQYKKDLNEQIEAESSDLHVSVCQIINESERDKLFGKPCSTPFMQSLSSLGDVGLYSCLEFPKDQEEFVCFLNYMKPTELVEIGTFRGISAGFIAKYFAQKVYTIDIDEFPIKYHVWNALGVTQKVESIVLDSELKKKKMLEHLKFDSAFIDGSHLYDDVKWDFECVKHCGRVLFDDATPRHPGVWQFVNELPKEKLKRGLRFALWEA